MTVEHPPPPLPVVRVAEIPREDQPTRWLVDQLWGGMSGNDGQPRRGQLRGDVARSLGPGNGPPPTAQHLDQGAHPRPASADEMGPAGTVIP